MGSGNTYVLEDHFVTAGCTHAEVIPRLAEPNAGCVAVHEERPDPRRDFVGTAPNSEPCQARTAGRIDLAAVENPRVTAIGQTTDRAGQTAARGRTQLRLHPQRVDERAVFHGIARYLFFQRLRPVWIGLQAQMIKTLHHEDQCRRRLAASYRAYHLQHLRQRRLPAAERLRYRQCEQAGASQSGEIIVGKDRIMIQRSGARREILSERGEPLVGGSAVEIGEGVERDRVLQGSGWMPYCHRKVRYLRVLMRGELGVETRCYVERRLDHARSNVEVGGALLLGDHLAVDRDGL